MKKQVLFIHGGGDDGYEADGALVASLQAALGNGYTVRYPRMIEEDTENFAPHWLRQIGEEIAAAKDGIMLAGHSLGASMLLKYLSENKVEKKIEGMFLIAPPFWNGDQDWVQPLKLRDGFADRLPKDFPLFFYQCRDDDVVPFSHFTRYQQHIPWATYREIASGGHQLDDDAGLVAKDIKDH